MPKMHDFRNKFLKSPSAGDFPPPAPAQNDKNWNLWWL